MSAPSDRRLLRSNGAVAHVSLQGLVEAGAFVDPKACSVAAEVADLLSAPDGARDRQILRGAVFNVLELRDAHAFGYAEADGYVGWLEAAALVGAPEEAPTHRVSVARSYAKSTPGLKAMGRVTPLTHGARLAVLAVEDGWAHVAWSRGLLHQDRFVPVAHLSPVDSLDADPVAVSERLLGTPYLWGGNSAFGIDCSGLVQAGCHACGIACPGDSDMQARDLGETLPPGTRPQRGDLMFWRGHVAWVSDPETLLHANAHTMSVAFEPIRSAIARIEAQGDGPVTRHARIR